MRARKVESQIAGVERLHQQVYITILTILGWLSTHIDGPQISATIYSPKTLPSHSQQEI